LVKTYRQRTGKTVAFLLQTILAVLFRRPRSLRAESALVAEMPFAWDMVYLDVNTVGILEQDGVISWGKL
jgi:hypothetical protein